MITELDAVKYSDYSEWKPEDYLSEYYSELMPDEQFAMEFLADWAGKTPFAPTALEFGCGPTVHHLFPIAQVAGEIHMAEYLSSNREAVQDWIDRKPGAHNWDEFARETLRLRGHESPGMDEIQQVQDEARRRITAILPGDAFDPDPLGAGAARFVSAGHEPLLRGGGVDGSRQMVRLHAQYPEPGRARRNGVPVRVRRGEPLLRRRPQLPPAPASRPTTP